jgi:hypothetical protein
VGEVLVHMAAILAVGLAGRAWGDGATDRVHFEPSSSPGVAGYVVVIPEQRIAVLNVTVDPVTGEAWGDYGAVTYRLVAVSEAGLDSVPSAGEIELLGWAGCRLDLNGNGAVDLEDVSSAFEHAQRVSLCERSE